MTLNTSSRYTTNVDESSTNVIAIRKKTTSVRYTNYVTRAEESFESIATRVFRDGTQYWRIADLNPHVKFPDMIPTGTIIRLPA
jgi:nucleoid-associated protein YgaU